MWCSIVWYEIAKSCCNCDATMLGMKLLKELQSCDVALLGMKLLNEDVAICMYITHCCLLYCLLRWCIFAYWGDVSLLIEVMYLLGCEMLLVRLLIEVMCLCLLRWCTFWGARFLKEVVSYCKTVGYEMLKEAAVVVMLHSQVWDC